MAGEIQNPFQPPTSQSSASLQPGPPSPGPQSPGSLTSRMWIVSGLLLLATMLNYMDRQTLANLKVRIQENFSLLEEQYGDIELGFGWAFAAGSLFFGLLADRYPVRWLYPIILLLWSAVGILTGLTRDYQSLLICRTLLGFFEAGHWPCALRTTQSVLTSRGRLMGNSLLQSGGALGAILTPIVIRLIVGDSTAIDAWRSPFWIVGGAGIVWIVGWLLTIRADDVPVSREPSQSLWRTWTEECISNRRFWIMIPVVISINLPWQLIRAWLPSFLQGGRGATEAQALWFNSVYYIATDVGCLAAGAASLWLARHGLNAHRGRMVVFGMGCVLTALTVVVAQLPLGWPLYAVLLLVGAGSLGVFPCYYSLTQDVSPGHVGKISGLLAAVSWLVTSPFQKIFGWVIDRTGSYDLGLGLVGLTPLLGLLALLLWWKPPVENHER
ncbi:MAG: MFS transporter [Planctomycetaceae bacterium]|nr:MFS transporter [Planctomycetaceae bacterium]